jgi:hypothetical protein
MDEWDISSLRHKFEGLLDLYEEESRCTTYNGWFRHRSPEDIRDDINKELEVLFGLLQDQSEGSDA